MFEFNVTSLHEYLVSQDRTDRTIESLTGRISDNVSYEDLSPREILGAFDALDAA
ncbi:hypothetical protein [Corynebacterium ulceribovis]|uniref:hypothetical protein n=1 Tax=Corynebacterium ulceribovis TaxID=487732 RepID=UPI00039CCF47|nr:hypothetical protein [Corynebacterium ulceribovis]